MKRLILIMLLFSAFANAQVLYMYPKKQDSYKDGYKGFYSDLAKVLKEKNYQTCPNKKEAINVKVLVNVDGSVAIVKEEDELAIKNNQCAYDMIKSALPYLKNWQPAEVNGQKTRAVARFLFVPNEFINNIPTDKLSYVSAIHPDGIDGFRKKFMVCFNSDKFNWYQDFSITTYFEVNTEGDLQFIHADPVADNEEFMNMIVRCLHYNKKKKWTPASYRGTNIVDFPFVFKLNFRDGY